MDLVGAALEGDIDGRAGGVGGLPIVGGRLDLELLHRIGGGDKSHTTAAATTRHVGAAVEGKLVASRCPVGDDRRGPRVVKGAGELEVAGIGDAGRQAGEDKWIPI